MPSRPIIEPLPKLGFMHKPGPKLRRIPANGRIGYLVDRSWVVCEECHTNAHDRAYPVPIYRATVHPYRVVCGQCGALLADGKKGEPFARVRPHP